MQNFTFALLVMLVINSPLNLSLIMNFPGFMFYRSFTAFPHSRLTSKVIVVIFDERWFLLCWDLWVASGLSRSFESTSALKTDTHISKLSNYQIIKIKQIYLVKKSCHFFFFKISLYSDLILMSRSWSSSLCCCKFKITLEGNNPSANVSVLSFVLLYPS